MSKELEVLGNIESALWDDNFHYQTHKEDLEVIEQALQRLEAIENSNPSEALECLRQIGIIEMYSHEGTLLKDSISFKPEYDTIKNYILKAQEQKMVLKILFEKNVNIFQLRMLCETLDEYNARPKEERLTEKEFNLLKEMVECLKS